MALQTIAASAPSETYARINAAIAAINKAVSDILDLSTAEEGAARSIFDLRTDVNSLITSVTDLVTRLAAEATARAETDANFSTNVAGLTAGLAALKALQASDSNNLYPAITDLVQKVSDLRTDLTSDETNIYPRLGALTDGLAAVVAEIDGLGRVTAPAIAALQALTSALSRSADATAATIDARRYEFAANLGRPGEVPAAFGFVDRVARCAGKRTALAPVPSEMVAYADHGAVVRVTGSGVLAMRRVEPVEFGRVKRLNAVVQRRTNVADPSGDAVVVALGWLDQGLNLMSGAAGITVVKRFDDLTTGAGRQSVEVPFARGPVPNLAAIQAPAAARFAVGLVLFYGPDGVTDVEVLGTEDVSAATVLDPISADVAAAVAAQQSLDLGPRMDAAEAALNAPNSVTYDTRGAAVAAKIPATVTTVSLRGRDSAGDGFDGLYRRLAGALAAGEDGFVSHGVSFRRVSQAQKAFEDSFLRSYVAMLAGLPKSPPPEGGPWDSDGSLIIAGPAS
jgi:hypothetical protein